jgi:GTP-binding protein HflX
MDQKTRAKAVLVGIQLPKIAEQENRSSLRELGRLVDTLGYQVIGEVSQKRPNLSGATVVGEGKLRELARWTDGPGIVSSAVKVKKHKAALRQEKLDSDLAQEKDGVEEESIEDETSEQAEPLEDDITGPQPTERAEVVIFDCELTPSQMRNLESASGVKVLDRTGVIIEIFSRHARTRAAQLQVEIARLNYLAPRLRETGGANEDRQGGGVGGKGAGETSQELDRRRIRDRVKELKGELETVQYEHSVRRARRSSENSVALVGYTNAGKSSLMRAMTGSDVYVADRLFATLDTTVRPIYPESMPKILISDTVGFIKQLPHDLVASFRSTLDEAAGADLLLFVVDVSDPTFRDQLVVTQTVLSEIGVVDTPSRLLLNKRDLLKSGEFEELKREYPEAIFLSTRDAGDLLSLREELLKFFEKGMVDAEIFVPYTTQGAIGEIRLQMRVLSEDFDEKGIRLRVRSRQEALDRFKSHFPDIFNAR